jgi:hypothetical protein
MAWFDRRWQYRKSHVIEGSAGAGTNYQVRIRSQDDVFTRKYLSPEPAHGAWGPEYRVPRIQGFVM